jgi:hypothetical protein
MSITPSASVFSRSPLISPLDGGKESLYTSPTTQFLTVPTDVDSMIATSNTGSSLIEKTSELLSEEQEHELEDMSLVLDAMAAST